MKKILIPIVILTGLAACKKDNNVQSEKLEILIKNKDIKGIEAYKERQKFKIDSLNQVMLNIDENLVSMGVVPDASGVVSTKELEISNFVHNVEIQVAGAQSNTNLAKIAYEKQAALWKQKIGSEFQLLQAKANYDAALKSVSAMNSQVSGLQRAADAVKANLAKTAIVAPFSGVVDEVITQNGQVVSPGTDIVKLISLGMMRVEADVPETYLAKVRQGTSVKVFLPTLNQTISSSVRLVGNYINPTNRTFKIEIPISNSGGVIKPNLLAQVKIEDYVNPNAIQVAQQYIFEDASKRSYVFVASNIKGKDAVARKVFVNPGEKSENVVEITTGLKAGDIIITVRK